MPWRRRKAILYRPLLLAQIALLVLLLAKFSQVASAANEAEGNERVCGVFGIEAGMFEAWRDLANKGWAASPSDTYSYEPLSLQRPGSVILEGVRIYKRGDSQAARAIFFLQGNAMRAEQLLDDLSYFVDRGFDVFVFDYRGYGNSSGNPLLKPISLDQAKIAALLKEKQYREIYMYGISMGGVFALGPHTPTEFFDGVAIDSSPAVLPWYALCPSEYDPLSNVPNDASRYLVISGGTDRIVPADDVKPLGDRVEERGGKFVHKDEWGHPLADSHENTVKRFELVADFFDSLHE